MKEFLKNLLSIESVAYQGDSKLPYGEGPAKALDYTLQHCAQLGFKTVNNGYRYGYAEIGGGDRLIGILCHLDVVPAGDGWESPAFSGNERNGRLYGRGVTDDKGPVAAVMYAMKDVLDRGEQLNARVRLILGQTEETGDWVDLEEYKKHEELPDVGFTPDADFPLIVCEKGILMTKVTMPVSSSGIESVEGGDAPNMVPAQCKAVVGGKTVQASGRPAHGSKPWEGENAITRVMAEIDAPFAEMYRQLFADSHYGEKAGIGFSDAESGKLTVNPGLIEVAEGNVELYLDIRFPVTVSRREVMDSLKKSVTRYGADVSEVLHMDECYIDADSPLANALLSAYREETSDMSEPLVIGGGTYARSIDGIAAFGPMMPGQELTAHCANEYMEVEQLNQLRRIYRSAIMNLINM